jgi:hypothetical protein
MKPARITAFVVLAVALCVAGAAFAQTVVDTVVKSGTVVGKTDHSVVVTGDDGLTREYEVPPGRTALVDGKEVGLADLKLGTKLSVTIHTISKPVEVKTVRIRQGEVVKVQGSTLVYKENDKIYTKTVPTGFRFNVEGRGETAVNDLTPGMKLTATIVDTTMTTKTETERERATGKAPAEPAPAVAAAPAPTAAPAPEKPAPPPEKPAAKPEAPAPAPATTAAAAPETPAMAAATPVPPAPTPAPEPAKSSSMTIVIGLIALIVIIALIVLGTRKKS